MSCSRCHRTPCGCNQVSCANPTPYYAQVDVCAEDNCQKIYYNQFSLGLKIESSWNVPQCGGAAILNVPGVIAIPVGEYLHNPIYGYFQIISFDAIQEQISIQNPCLTDNSPPGTEVPPCTMFTIGPPPCCDNVGQDGVFVAVDFTAPADGDCIDITVTDEIGLIAGNDVSIGTGIYLLNEIKSNNIINICNQGEGIIPGTPVIAKNIAGLFQYRVQLITVNPCAQTPVTSGKVQVCDNLTGKILTGGSNGQLLTLTDFTTGEAAYSSNETNARITADNNLTASIQALRGFTLSDLSVAKAGGVVPFLPVFISNTASITVNNTSVAYQMAVFCTFIARCQGATIAGANTDQVELRFDLEIDVFGSGFISVIQHDEAFYLKTDTASPMDREVTFAGFAGPLATTSSDSINARLTVTLLSAFGGYGMSNCDVSVSAICVAVQP